MLTLQYQLVLRTCLRSVQAVELAPAQTSSLLTQQQPCSSPSLCFPRRLHPSHSGIDKLQAHKKVPPSAISFVHTYTKVLSTKPHPKKHFIIPPLALQYSVQYVCLFPSIRTPFGLRTPEDPTKWRTASTPCLYGRGKIGKSPLALGSSASSTRLRSSAGMPFQSSGEAAHGCRHWLELATCRRFARDGSVVRGVFNYLIPRSTP